jgi:hypothetical protein
MIDIFIGLWQAEPGRDGTMQVILSQMRERFVASSRVVDSLVGVKGWSCYAALLCSS